MSLQDPRMAFCPPTTGPRGDPGSRPADRPPTAMVIATQHKLMQLVGAHPYGGDGVNLGFGQARRPQIAAFRTIQAHLDEGWPIAVPHGKQGGGRPRPGSASNSRWDT